MKKTTLIILTFLLIAITAYADEGKVENFNYVRVSSDGTGYTGGSEGQWDEGGIREIGNVLYDATESNDSRRYKALYTGKSLPLSGTNVYVGMVFSSTIEDGKAWTKYSGNPVLSVASEDPYFVFNNGSYYMYYEDKVDDPFRDTNLATSNDGVIWTESGANPILEPVNDTWESQDVSSPVVWIEDNAWYMLYEGRETDGQQGSMGLATSIDGIVWNKYIGNPVMLPGEPGSWDDVGVIPDDIIKRNNMYYMFYHGLDSVFDTSDGGMAYSTDLINWTKWEENPISGSPADCMVFTSHNTNKDYILNIHLYEFIKSKITCKGVSLRKVTIK
jgi:predicted GH43/DUF377 family glycosyl hydrolase